MFLLPLICLLQNDVADSTRTNPYELSRFATVFDASDQHLVGLTPAKELAVWDATTGQLVHVLKGNSEPIIRGRLSPNGKWVLGQTLDPQTDSATWGLDGKPPRDRSMRLWDIKTGKVRWRIPNAFFDALSRDGRRIYGVEARVSPNIEKPKLSCWDLATGRKVFTMPKFVPFGFLSNIVEESADGRRLLYADRIGTRVFDLTTRKQLVFLDSFSSQLSVFRSALTAAGDAFFFAGPEGAGAISLISIPSGRLIQKMSFPSIRANHIAKGAYDTDGIVWLPKAVGFIAIGDGGLYSFRRGERLVTHRRVAHGGGYGGLIMSPNEESFAMWTVREEDQIKSFSISGYNTKTFTKFWDKPGLPIVCLPSGELVIEDRDTVRFVDMATGRELRAVRREGY